jgi:hypothetical protein
MRPLAAPPEEEETRPEDMLDWEPVPMKKCVFAGLEVFVEGDFVHSDADVFGAAGNFLVFFHAGFAAADAAERTDLKFAAVAFLLEFDQRVVGGAGAIRNIKIKNRAAILHMIFRGGALEDCVPVLAANAVGGEAGGASAGFSARDGGAFDEDEGGTVLPIDADFGRRKIRIGAAVVTTGEGGGVGLIITLMTASETLAVLRALRPSMEVSNLEASAPVALRILAMMTSSERLRLVISMMS